MKLLSIAIAGLSAFSLASAASPDLTKLGPCALKCVIGAVVSLKCAGPADTKCICTETFTNAATKCLYACPVAEVVPALNLEREICPDLGLPNLDSLSSCSQGCVLKTLQKTKCNGPLDKECICSLNFGIQAGLCLLGQCGLPDLGPTIGLEIGICKPKGSIKECTATGLWKILQPACWFKPHRRATPEAGPARRRLEA